MSKAKQIEVTAENYFSPEVELAYFGHSQFCNFVKCEAAEMARIRGDYEEPKTTALLIGSYVDAYFEGSSEKFAENNPEIFTRGGELRAEFRRSEKIIDRIERDPMMMKYMSGQKQVIKTGEIFGVPAKIKIDSYHPGICLVDLKVMKDFDSIYIEGQGRVPFVEAWGYDIQAAFYQEVEGNNLPFFLAAVTKEEEPDIKVLQISQNVIDAAKKIIESKIHRFADIKLGKIEPERCEKCNYCKKTKVLDEVEVYEGWGD